MPAFRVTSAVAVGFLALGCSDATGPGLLAPNYTLVEAAGKPVPAIVQLVGEPGGIQNGYQVVGRSIEFRSGSRVTYAEASASVTITNNGADTLVNIFSCSRSAGTVTRKGNTIYLHFGPPGIGWTDTLRLESRQLVDSVAVGVGVRAPIRYSPGEPASPICPDLE